MLDCHSCQICYPIEMKSLLLILLLLIITLLLSGEEWGRNSKGVRSVSEGIKKSLLPKWHRHKGLETKKTKKKKKKKKKRDPEIQIYRRNRPSPCPAGRW